MSRHEANVGHAGVAPREMKRPQWRPHFSLRALMALIAAEAVGLVAYLSESTSYERADLERRRAEVAYYESKARTSSNPRASLYRRLADQARSELHGINNAPLNLKIMLITGFVVFPQLMIALTYVMVRSQLQGTDRAERKPLETRRDPSRA